MTQPRDDERIAHMVEACEEGIAFVAGRGRADLDDDRVLQLALCKLIENVGEAAKAVTPAFRAKYSGVEWSSAARMRDRVVHHYFQIDLDIVWSTVSPNSANRRDPRNEAGGGVEGCRATFGTTKPANRQGTPYTDTATPQAHCEGVSRTR